MSKYDENFGRNYAENERKQDEVCFFCNKRPNAYWWGGTSEMPFFFICKACAYDVLPSLFADAVAETKSPKTFDLLKSSLNTFEKFFWRAAAAVVSRCH